MVASARIGALFAKRRRTSEPEVHEAFGVIEGATLTLLGLIIGFSFSMAVDRYEQRKNYEEAEANAIGTEFLRADLLSTAAAATVRSLLLNYLDQRILFYTTRDEQTLRQVNDRTNKLQAELWSAVKVPAVAQPTPIAALAVAGMNDVLNSQGYTQAAWWNRIPNAAWGLMAAIGILANALVGLGVRNARSAFGLLLVLPLVVAVAFFLIADIDSPRGGLIRVGAPNLQSLSDSLRSQ